MTSYVMDKKEVDPLKYEDYYVYMEYKDGTKSTYQVVFSRNVNIETETIISSPEDHLFEMKRNIYTVKNKSKPAVVVCHYHNNITGTDDTILDLYYVMEYISSSGWVFLSPVDEEDV
jgi:hypothetical protein